MARLTEAHIKSLLAIRFRENEVPRNLDALRFARSFYEPSVTDRSGNPATTSGADCSVEQDGLLAGTPKKEPQ